MIYIDTMIHLFGASNRPFLQEGTGIVLDSIPQAKNKIKNILDKH